MSALYQAAPGITYNQPEQGAWLGTGKCYNRVEGNNMTDLYIYFMAIITTTIEIHRRNKIIGLVRSVIITSLRKFTLAGNISTD